MVFPECEGKKESEKIDTPDQQSKKREEQAKRQGKQAIMHYASLEEGLAAIQRGDEAVSFSYKAKIGPDGAKKVAAELKNNRTLILLDLEGNKIGDEGAGSLAEALKVNSTLTSLDLKYNDIGPEGAGSLAEALKVNSTLTTLDLRSNIIGDEGAGSLAEALKRNSTLTELYLWNNGIGNAGDRSLVEALKFNSSLTEFDRFVDNRAFVAIILKINKGFVQNRIELINTIPFESIPFLAARLEQLVSLTSFDLSRNSLGSIDFPVLANSFSNLPNLTELNLSSNGMTAEHVWVLCQALMQHKTIKKLNLKNNPIEDEGILHVARADFPLLDWLDVRNTKASTAKLMVLCTQYPETEVLCDHRKVFNLGTAACIGRDVKALGLSPVDLLMDFDAKLTMDSGTEGATRRILDEAIYGERGAGAIRRLKLLVVGPQAVGKTSLTRALFSGGKKADATSAHDDDRATISADVHMRKITYATKSGVARGRMSFWDFGGQEEYYMTHAFFLSRRSVVLLVVDLSTYEPESEESFDVAVGRWLRALRVQMDSPKIILVGTKADKVETTVEARMESLRGKIDAMNDSLAKSIEQHGSTTAVSRMEVIRSFAVSNTNLSGVKALFEFQQRLAMDPDLGVAMRVPKVFQDILNQLTRRADSGEKLGKYHDLLVESGLLGSRQYIFDAALELLHDIGQILWYKDSPDLREHVFLQPEWVVNVVASIFRHDMFVIENVETGERKPGRMYQLRDVTEDVQKRFRKHARLDMRLLQELPIRIRDDEEMRWKDFDVTERKLYISLLKRFELLYDMPRKSEKDPEEYMAPLFLRSTFPGQEDRSRKSFLQSARMSIARRLSRVSFSPARHHVVHWQWEFYAFLPHGLFFRLVARCYRLGTYVSLSENELVCRVEYKDDPSVDIRIAESRDFNGCGRIEMQGAIRRGASSDEDTAKRRTLLMETFSLFLQEMGLLLGQFHNLPYDELILSAGNLGISRKELESALEQGLRRIEFHEVEASFDASKTSGSVKTRTLKTEPQVVQPREERSGSIVELNTVVPPSSLLAYIPPDTKLQEERLWRYTWQFKFQLRNRLDKNMRRTTNVRSKVEVTFQCLQALYGYLRLAHDEPFPLEEGDCPDLLEACEELVSFAHDLDAVDRLVSEEQAIAMSKTVIRLESRVRTAYDAFFSHNWGKDLRGRDNHARVTRVAELLSERFSIRCWLDQNDVGNRVRQSMAEGISQSQTVVFFLTQDFIDKVSEKSNSDNCALEYNLADRQKDADYLIPVMMEEELKEEWRCLGVPVIAGLLWHDLSHDDLETCRAVNHIAGAIMASTFPQDPVERREALLQLYRAKASK